MKKNKIISIILSTFLFVICVVIVMVVKNHDEDLTSYDVVFFGDSIIAGDYSDMTVPHMLQEEIGLYVLNAAYGGKTMSVLEGPVLTGDTAEVFSMYRLSESVLNRDFSLQVIASQKDNLAVLDGIYNTSDSLKHTDWERVKYVLIEYGANDYLEGVILDNKDNLYDIHTFGGAIRKSIENVQEALPGAQIIIVTPIYMNPDSMSGDCNEADFGGGLLKDYVEIEKQIATEYDLYVIDNFNELEINAENFAKYLYDGIHANNIGKEYIADNIAKHLEEIDGSSSVKNK